MSIQIISYNCNLKNRMGRTISSSVVRDVLLDPEGGQTQLKALSMGLRDIKKGEVREILLLAHEAYGLYDPKLVMTRFIDESDIDAPLKIDEKVLVVKDGIQVPMRVIHYSSDMVTLDGNHPLAGQDLVFEIHVFEAREATSDEIHDGRLDLPILH